MQHLQNPPPPTAAAVGDEDDEDILLANRGMTDDDSGAEPIRQVARVPSGDKDNMYVSGEGVTSAFQRQPRNGMVYTNVKISSAVHSQRKLQNGLGHDEQKHGGEAENGDNMKTQRPINLRMGLDELPWDKIAVGVSFSGDGKGVISGQDLRPALRDKHAQNKHQQLPRQGPNHHRDPSFRNPSQNQSHPLNHEEKQHDGYQERQRHEEQPLDRSDRQQICPATVSNTSTDQAENVSFLPVTDVTNARPDLTTKSRSITPTRSNTTSSRLNVMLNGSDAAPTGPKNPPPTSHATAIKPEQVSPRLIPPTRTSSGQGTISAFVSPPKPTRGKPQNTTRQNQQRSVQRFNQIPVQKLSQDAAQRAPQNSARHVPNEAFRQGGQNPTQQLKQKMTQQLYEDGIRHVPQDPTRYGPQSAPHQIPPNSTRHSAQAPARPIPQDAPRRTNAAPNQQISRETIGRAPQDPTPSMNRDGMLSTPHDDSLQMNQGPYQQMPRGPIGHDTQGPTRFLHQKDTQQMPQGSARHIQQGSTRHLPQDGIREMSYGSAPHTNQGSARYLQQNISEQMPQVSARNLPPNGTYQMSQGPECHMYQGPPRQFPQNDTHHMTQDPGRYVPQGPPRYLPQNCGQPMHQGPNSQMPRNGTYPMMRAPGSHMHPGSNRHLPQNVMRQMLQGPPRHMPPPQAMNYNGPNDGYMPEKQINNQTPRNPPMNQSSNRSSQTPPSTSTSTSTGKKLTVEVGPDISMPLRGADETWKAIEDGKVTITSCISCQIELNCVADAQLVICPECTMMSPVDQTDESEKGVFARYGVGVGVKPEDVVKWIQSNM